MSLHQPVSGSGAGGGGGAGTDELVKVSANDTTAGYLNGKLVAGTAITLTENNDGANETLTVASTATDRLATVSANDTTPGVLNGKLVAGTNITLNELNDGANESLQIVAASFAPLGSPYVTLGADATLTAEVNIQQAQWVNLVKNSPGQIVVDGAEPQWWDDVANATLTDEDAAGEAIADKTERVFKVVTTANDVYGYQTFTFADESLLDAGQTVVSASCWVYCASANKASIGLYGANMGLTESSQHTGGASWELLTVENLTLNGADTSIQLRLIVDTGTAYFTMPTLNVGSKALPWRERSLGFYPLFTITQVAGPTGDVAWSDTDATANTDPLAVLVQLHIYVMDTVGDYVYTCHDDAFGADIEAVSISTAVAAVPNRVNGIVFMNDSQIFRYSVGETDADNDVSWYIQLIGYWRWVP